MSTDVGLRHNCRLIEVTSTTVLATIPLALVSSEQLGFVGAKQRIFTHCPIARRASSITRAYSCGQIVLACAVPIGRWAPK